MAAASTATGRPVRPVAVVSFAQSKSMRREELSNDVEMLQPMHAAGDQETLHLATAEIVDVGVPVLMKAFLRIGMFIQRSAVEPRHAVGIGHGARRG